MKKLILAHPAMPLQSGRCLCHAGPQHRWAADFGQATQSVWTRLLELVGAASAAMLALKAEHMRLAGLSARKVAYLHALATGFAEGPLGSSDWDSASDEDIVQQLVAIRGVGRWTAEMFLIFHLHRPDVLPLDDVGLVNGISRAYYSGEPVSRSDVRELARAWSPYSTVATWYIWRSLEAAPVMH